MRPVDATEPVWARSPMTLEIDLVTEVSDAHIPCLRVRVGMAVGATVVVVAAAVAVVMTMSPKTVDERHAQANAKRLLALVKR